MTLDPLILSRLQFVWVIGWHILLPAFTIGLASFIAVMEGAHIVTGRDVLFRISSFWIKIFSVAFGMGVVSGIVMPFQFGTNWSRYSAATANILAPLFAYEGIVAFFLEAAFLGVLLFGRKLVSRSAPCSRHSGSSLRTAGCKHRRVTRLSMADSSRWTGSPSSSTRPFPIASPTWSALLTSRPASWC